VIVEVQAFTSCCHQKTWIAAAASFLNISFAAAVDQQIAMQHAVSV